ncbi:Hypothetical protein CpMEX9_1422 [Corynebacterium pseudotuberculosis]|nr:Hypothetical protein Cp12C_1502 [Corynebacterium pseudotuberculosis]ANH26189.1 Hypothetical protein CpMEX9_1422 [Corynebacterium pseudotuberculosis]
MVGLDGSSSNPTAYFSSYLDFSSFSRILKHHKRRRERAKFLRIMDRS